jgi:hypothetical protein
MSTLTNWIPLLRPTQKAKVMQTQNKKFSNANNLKAFRSCPIIFSFPGKTNGARKNFNIALAVD